MTGKNEGFQQVVWHGGVNAWECDDMGHMNTRFYVQRATEGLAMLFAQTGMPGIFSPHSPTTAVIREMHIRFHREARISARLQMSGAITSLGDTNARALLVLRDVATGETKATFRVILDHVDRDNESSPVFWPGPFSERAAAQIVTEPDNALPRSTGSAPVTSSASGRRAREIGLMRIGAGAIGPDRLDAFGRMAAHCFIGAVSDGIRTLTAPFREIAALHEGIPSKRVGGAVVEFRILHLDWPRAGDVYEIHSGLASVEGSAKSIIHWMLDPISERVYGSMQSIAVDFDLEHRSIIKPTPAALADLRAYCVPELTL